MRPACVRCGHELGSNTPFNVCDGCTHNFKRLAHEGFRPYLAILALQEYDREALARHRRIIEVLA